ncbi:DUF222 domain-containing protein [Nocardioides zeae]|uniref:DUF222 domain-containing protein n=1 Tax=Nocardioides imazamoxiresistens TaxID=3231893 RepID=A0ABU3Q176_9ACTN|nr:DUF222 domain-containing protein [Nocardioides zeae]MDT9595253.1 DUF222 domain-containing protein [Nocardioides zeae]
MAGGTGTFSPGSGHPVLAALARADRGVGDALELGLLTLGEADARSALVAAQRHAARTAALAAKLAARADELQVGRVDGSPSTAVWFANATGVTRGEAHRVLRVGQSAARYVRLAAAAAAGAVSLDQADVIVRALDALPDDIDAETAGRAEEVLVENAGRFDALALRKLGKRILDVVAPEVGEAHEARLLAAEERSAMATASLTLRDLGDGRTSIRGILPTLHAEMLGKALDAYAAPGHKNAGSDEADRFTTGTPSPLRRGEAFVELIEALDARDLPEVGGTNATVVVNLDLDALLRDLGVATLDTGGRISAAEARRLACSANLVPAVLGGASEVLDLGRAQRYHSKPQRLAIALRDKTCVTDGCDRPAHQCQVHHWTLWSAGGTTNTTDAALLCGHHHRKVHDPRYETRRTRHPLGHTSVRFVRRP